MQNKIALEEHILTPDIEATWDDSGEAERNGAAYMSWVSERLLDVEKRVEDMDACGIAKTILSLTSPGIQSITDVKVAVDAARTANDRLHEHFVRAHPDRFAFFASVAMQDPAEAGHELERAVTDLGAKGAIINGYTNVGDDQTARYLDEPENAPFWHRVADLGVPVYLHPREPLPTQRRIYDGYTSLIGSAWAFGHETATHAVRLMLSGLFDTHPDITIILGHLGEGLPFTLPRLEHRLSKQRDGIGRGSAKHTVSHYFNRNFLLTTSGHFHTRTLYNALGEIGADRVLFSIDYPYETMQDAAAWFDASLLSHNDRRKVGRENAERIFDL
jgi:predicted TIM-barrel fold metal-dependent hydrolase